MRPFSLLTALAAGLLSVQLAGAATTDLGNVVQLDVGGRHACAVTAAGGVKCWGDNTNGILGDGTTTSRAWAGDVSGLGSGVTAVTTSRGWDIGWPEVAHSCALLATGEVRCWGDNSLGQLGIGTTTGFETTPAAPVALGASAIAVSAGWAHTCALLVDGTVTCWGYDGESQLGPGTFGSSPLTVPGLSDIVQISAGPARSCAVNAAGAVKCWPFHSGGQDGPYDILGLSAPVASVSVGGTKTHICRGSLGDDQEVCSKVTRFLDHWHACAVLTTAAVQCWGFNGSGELGVGSTNTPVQLSLVDVSGLSSGAVQVSAGGYRTVPLQYSDFAHFDEHTCAVTAGGNVKCWGRNKCGVLGNGGVADCTPHNPPANTADPLIVPAPVDVVGPTGIKSVAAGGEFACALSAVGNVSCWGLGYGSTPLAVIAGTPPTGTVVSAPAARLGNISTRADVLTGSNVVIAGFVIGGSASKTIAIQATGPALTRAGIATPLTNPSITLVRSSDQSVVATNDNWTGAANASQVQDSGFAPTMANEPAIVATLAPGAYTAIVSGADGGTGTGVVGIFELDHPEAPLINISTRAQVLTGEDVMIAGFVVQGTAPQNVAVTVAGPSLGSAGITNALGDPMLTLVRQSDGAVIASNDNWEAGGTAGQLQAAGFAPASSLEPGVLLSLVPGAYTVVVQGAGNTTGVAVVGVFAVP